MDDMILMEKHDGLGNIAQNEGQMFLGNPLVTRVKSLDQINYGSTLTVLEFRKKDSTQMTRKRRDFGLLPLKQTKSHWWPSYNRHHKSPED